MGGGLWLIRLRHLGSIQKSGNKYFCNEAWSGEQNVVDIRSSKADAPYHLTDLGKKKHMIQLLN